MFRRKISIPHIAAVFVLAVLPAGAFPQQADAMGTGDPLLDSLIARATAGHPDLQKMRQMIGVEEARRAMSRSLMNPDLRLGLMDLPNDFKFDEDPATAFEIGAMQRFPFPGKRSAADAAAAARVDAARVDLQTARQEMAAMAAMNYYDLAGLMEMDSLLHEGLALSEEMTRAAEWMAGSAMGRQSDIGRARLEEENWRLKIIANRGEIARKKAALTYAAGGDLEDSFDAIHLPLDPPEVPDIDSLLASGAVDRSPAVRLAATRLDAAGKDLTRTRLNWYPDFDVMLAYGLKPDLRTAGGVDMTGNPVAPGTIDQRNMISLEVTFPVPIFSRGNQRAQVSEMTAMRAGRAAQLADAKIAKVKELREIIASIKEQSDCCALVQQTIIVRAQALHNTALIDYRAGRTPFMELSQARMSLVMAKMELAMARAEAWGLRARFLAAIGALAGSQQGNENE